MIRPVISDGADQRGAERGAELLRGELQAARLAAVGVVDRGLRHVAELGDDQPHPDPEHPHRDRERGRCRARARSSRCSSNGRDEQHHQAGPDERARATIALASAEPRHRGHEHRDRDRAASALPSRARRSPARPGGRAGTVKKMPIRIRFWARNMPRLAAQRRDAQQLEVHQRRPARFSRAGAPRPGSRPGRARRPRSRTGRARSRSGSIGELRGCSHPQLLDCSTPKTTRARPSAESTDADPVEAAPSAAPPAAP